MSICTRMFNPEEAKYAKGVMCELPYPTADTSLITNAALAGLERVYRVGLAYSNAEVLLLGLCQRNECSGSLFAPMQPAEACQVMGVLDQINSKWGRGVTQAAFLHASEGLDDHLAVATLGSLFHCVRRLVRLLVKSPELGCIAGQVG